jgi:hypothetical protein
LVARGDHTDGDKSVLASSKRLLYSGITGIDNPIEADAEVANGRSECSTGRSQMDLTNESLFLRHVVALTRKRAANFRRDKKAWFCTTLLPTTMVLAGLLLVTFLPSYQNLRPITLNFKELNPGISTEPVNPVSYNNPTNPFSCSPGLCSYTPQVVEVNGFTVKSFDDDPDISNTCSNAVSQEIIQFLSSGATGVEKDVVNIANVSHYSFVALPILI